VLKDFGHGDRKQRVCFCAIHIVVALGATWGFGANFRLREIGFVAPLPFDRSVVQASRELVLRECGVGFAWFFQDVLRDYLTACVRFVQEVTIVECRVIGFQRFIVVEFINVGCAGLRLMQLGSGVRLLRFVDC
jgi:hypothetical protein